MSPVSAPKIKTHYREKLVQAIVYFASHAQHCGKTKLFKLLFLLDFEHFRETGWSVTGLDYFAWKLGPVPVALDEEWDEGFKEDLSAAITIQSEPQYSYTRLTAVACVSFDDNFFSKRELRLLAAIAERYRDCRSGEMVDVTHAENGAWEKTLKERGYNARIDYELTLTGSDAPRIAEAAREYRELLGDNSHYDAPGR